MIQPAPKKTSVMKTTQKKTKLPANLPLYDYSKFSDEDRDRAYDYHKKELEKVEKILTDKLIKAAKRVGLSVNNQQSVVSNPPIGNPYMDIYGGQPNVSNYGGTKPYNAINNNNNMMARQQPVPAGSPPEVVASPIPYQPYTPGLVGDHMEMPSILGSSGAVVNTLKDDYQGNPTTFNGIQSPVETVKLPVVEDNSEQLGAELGALLNENY